jgi:hypothetical protein
MIQLQLTAEDARLLEETLKHVLSDLSVEIAGTDKKAYRDEIKDHRAALQAIADQLRQS